MESRQNAAWLPKTLGRLTILVSILLMNFGTPLPAAAQTGGSALLFSLFLPVVNNGEALPPTAQQLIQADLAAGRIDANTALLYRAYAVYGDPRLPGRYGGGFMVEDSGFFSLAEDPNLPADVKAQLEPFLLRPDDPGSVFNTAPAGNAPLAGGSAESLPCDLNQWAKMTSSKLFGDHRIVPVTVHAHCTGNYEQDIQTALQYIDALYEPMTALMGEPILDAGDPNGGGGPQIDIYLLNPLDELKRYTGEKNPLAGDPGLTRSALPYLGDTSSSYIMVDRQRVNDGIYFEQILAHEFFHSLELALNRPVLSVKGEVWWFTEASATWAEQHFVPAASAHTHHRFTYKFQYSFESLHAPYNPDDPGLIYASYIWPFFVEQENGAEAIARIWRGLRFVGSNWDVAMYVLDQEMPFVENFRRFALRNLNVSLQPGDPVQPRYVNLDPLFPDQKLPGYRVEVANVSPTPPDLPYLYDPTIPPLDARYYHFTYTTEVGRVELDLGDVSSQNDVAVQAVVKRRGKPWELRELTGQSFVKLCDIEELYLIISNERMKGNVDTSFTMSPLVEGCACEQIANVTSWDAEMTITYTIEADSSQKQVTERVNASITSHLEESYRNPSAIGFWTENLGGFGKIYYRNLWLYPNGDTYLYNELVGDGPPTQYDPVTSNGSRMALTFDMEKCTYHFYVGVWIMGTSADETHAPAPIHMGIAHVGSADYAVPGSALSGISSSGSFQAHTSDYIMGVWDNINFYAQDDYDIYQIMGGEDSMGAAQVSWSFIPTPPQ